MKPDPQLRLSLLALHHRVLRLGPIRNFYYFLALIIAGAFAVIYFLPSHYSDFAAVPIICAGFQLHRYYFIELPADKTILAFFEQNHPELCSWLEDSAVLEAAKMYETQKA